MPRSVGALLLVSLLSLFLIANRGAYGGYFQDDDLDNIQWTGRAGGDAFLLGFLTPQFAANNFRPTGHFYYWTLGRLAKLNYGPYVAVLHSVHLLNVWLLWVVIRRLGAGTAAAAGACLFFAFHMAVFQAYWRPMYIFDVACLTFCVLAILAYLHDRLILSIIAFWLAYKAKEMAVMLPFVLLLIEYWFAKRRWIRLLPFFAISASFGLQAILANRGSNSDYSLRFTAAAFWKCLSFYGSRLILLPFAAIGMVALPFLVRDRRMWFGLGSAGLLMLPMMFLPGRLYSVYLYVPLAGLAIAFSAAADRISLVWIAVFFTAWLPYNYRLLITERKPVLAAAHENRAYVAEASRFFAESPSVQTVVFDGRPEQMHRWGVEAALRLTSGQPGLEIYDMNDKHSWEALHRDSIAVLSWSKPQQKLFAATKNAGQPLQRAIRMGLEAPIWQLDEGWFPLESEFRWIGPRATALLHRPASARAFELTVNVGKMQHEENGAPSVDVFIDGKPVGSHQFTQTGWETARWAVPAGLTGKTRIEFRVKPEYRPRNGDPRTLGVAVVSFGFLP